MEQFHDALQNVVSDDSTLKSVNPSSDDISKNKYKNLFQRGLRWVGIGAFFLGLSFGINFIFFHSNGAFIPYMYVLTTLGGICVLKGLVDIFG